jgi:hypothetical protein
MFMHKGSICRWTLGAALIAGAIVGVVREASADHRLWVYSDQTNLSCYLDPSGNYIFGEAWGFDVFGTKYCEAMTQGGTAMARCPGNVTQHQARIDTRGQTASQTGTVYATSPMVTTWQQQSSAIGYSAPPSSGCPGGGSWTVASQGMDPPGGVP